MDTANAAAFELAFGRILRIGSRPSQPGDNAEYNRCRAICLEAAEGSIDITPSYAPNYARDRRKGAQGD